MYLDLAYLSKRNGWYDRYLVSKIFLHRNAFVYIGSCPEYSPPSQVTMRLMLSSPSLGTVSPDLRAFHADTIYQDRKNLRMV